MQDLFNEPVFPEIETFTYYLYNFYLYLISTVVSLIFFPNHGSHFYLHLFFKKTSIFQPLKGASITTGSK